MLLIQPTTRQSCRVLASAPVRQLAASSLLLAEGVPAVIFSRPDSEPRPPLPPPNTPVSNSTTITPTTPSPPPPIVIPPPGTPPNRPPPLPRTSSTCEVSSCESSRKLTVDCPLPCAVRPSVSRRPLVARAKPTAPQQPKAQIGQLLGLAERDPFELDCPGDVVVAAAEQPDAAAQQHRDQVEDELVEQPACRHCRVRLEPKIATSRSPAARWALATAASIPSETNLTRASATTSAGRWVSTNTVPENAPPWAKAQSIASSGPAMKPSNDIATADRPAWRPGRVGSSG